MQHVWPLCEQFDGHWMAGGKLLPKNGILKQTTNKQIATMNKQKTGRQTISEWYDMLYTHGVHQPIVVIIIFSAGSKYNETRTTKRIVHDI